MEFDEKTPEEILEEEKQEKLEKAFSNLILAINCLKEYGLDILEKAQNKDLFNEYARIGFKIAEDSSMRIKVLYEDHAGLHIRLEEKKKDLISNHDTHEPRKEKDLEGIVDHSDYELKKMEIIDKFKEHGIEKLLQTI